MHIASKHWNMAYCLKYGYNKYLSYLSPKVLEVIHMNNGINASKDKTLHFYHNIGNDQCGPMSFTFSALAILPYSPTNMYTNRSNMLLPMTRTWISKVPFIDQIVYLQGSIKLL